MIQTKAKEEPNFCDAISNKSINVDYSDLNNIPFGF